MKLVGKSEVKVSKVMIKKVVEGEGSKSSKIKKLFDLGMEVKDIVKEMDVRYQFGYNVISNYINIESLEVVKEEKESKKDKIIELYDMGKSNAEISKLLKSNSNYVFKVIKDLKILRSKVE